MTAVEGQNGTSSGAQRDGLRFIVPFRKPRGCGARSLPWQVRFAESSPMRLARHSHQTSKFMLRLIGLVGGGAFLGQVLQPGRGAAIGAAIGGVGLVFALARDAWIARRGEAWVAAGRALGLKSIYSGHIPPLPFRDMDEPANLLGGSHGRYLWFVGDRTERLLVESQHSAWNGGEPDGIILGGPPDRLTEPRAVETFVLVRMPGVEFPPVIAGKARSLFERRDDDRLAELGLRQLGDWLRRYPGWRLEAAGECVLASRPRILVAPSGLSPMKHAAEDLMARLEQITFSV